MTNSAEMLLRKMEEDKTFAEKILAQTENEKLIEIARGEGVELTMEDIGEINDSIAKALQQNKEGELTEDELESVAGGLLLQTVAMTTETFKKTLSALTITVISISEAVVSALSADPRKR